MRGGHSLNEALAPPPDWRLERQERQSHYADCPAFIPMAMPSMNTTSIPASTPSPPEQTELGRSKPFCYSHKQSSASWWVGGEGAASSSPPPPVLDQTLPTEVFEQESIPDPEDSSWLGLDDPF